MARFAWNENYVARVRLLASQGQSSAQIAAILSSEVHVLVRKGSVIGKCNRLGIKLDGWKSGNGNRRKRRVLLEAAAPAVTLQLEQPGEASAASIPPVADASPLPLRPVERILALGRRQCRWLDGDPKEFNYCLAPAFDLMPYCSHHALVAYRRRGDDR